MLPSTLQCTGQPPPPCKDSPGLRCGCSIANSGLKGKSPEVVEKHNHHVERERKEDGCPHGAWRKRGSFLAPRRKEKILRVQVMNIILLFMLTHLLKANMLFIS